LEIRMTRFRIAVVASCGAGLLGASLPAAAQLEEVAVTAERRESSLQRVPVAITAYTAEDLERFQIDSVTDIDVFAPSLRVVNNVASSNALNINLRGSTEAGGAFLFSEPGVDRADRDSARAPRHAVRPQHTGWRHQHRHQTAGSA